MVPTLQQVVADATGPRQRDHWSVQPYKEL